MSSFEIRPYQPGDEEGILSSFNVVFREVCGESYVDRDMATWRWLFADNPAGHRILLGVAQDGTIASQYAALPCRARTPLGPTVFSQIVDSFAHPGFRKGLKRPGIFVLNGSQALDSWSENEGDGLFYGYPVRAAERVGKRYMRYSMLRVVDFLVRELSAGKDQGPGDVKVARCDALGCEVDALAEAFADDRGFLTLRDRRYLDWRFAQATQAHYEFHAARRDGALVGLMVLRVEHDMLVEDACALADWIVPGADADVTDALLAAATRRGREAGRQRLIAVFPDPSPEYRMLRGRGFGIEPSSNTLERRLTYRMNQPGLTTEMLAERWYYTLSDSDLV